MKTKQLINKILCIMIIIASPAYAWRSILYPFNWTPPSISKKFASDRFLQDFSYAGYARGDKEVFRRTGPVFNVVSFGADPSGRANSTTAIQNAINACQDAGGGVVKFPNGTFKVSLPSSNRAEVLRVSKKLTVLRGNGPANTRILNVTPNMRGKALLRFREGGDLPNGVSTKLTRDLLGPTRRLYVQNPGAYAQRDLINIRWDFTDGWIREHGQQNWWGFGKFRPQSAVYQRIITRVSTSGGYVEINVPTRYFLKVRDNARIEKITKRLSECGIEDIALGERQVPGGGWGQKDFDNPSKGAYKCHGAMLVEFQRTRNCWMINVKTYRPRGNSTTCHIRSNGMRLSRAFYTSIINCRFERPQYGGEGGNGSMYNLALSNDNLFKNCTANFARHGFTLSGAGTSGNVFLRCKDYNTARATGNTGGYVTDGEGSDTHAHYTHANLFDNCTVNNSRFESFHRGGLSRAGGLTGSSNTFWSTRGDGRFSQTIITDQGRYGFVIGTKGSKTGVKTNQGTGTKGRFPVDFVEGVGRGSSLTPGSLFNDQKRRRTR